MPHWGDLLEEEKKPPPNLSADIERAMNKNFLKQYEDDDIDKNDLIETVNFPETNPLVMFAIEMHRIKRDITKKIDTGYLKFEEIKIPEIPEELKRSQGNSFIDYKPFQPTNFTLGKDTDFPHLNSEIAKQASKKSIATLFAQLGYESSEETALNTMVDVLEEFFKTIGHKLSVAFKNEEEINLSAYPEMMEKVLIESGLGGVREIHNFYQSRVVKYAQILHNNCSKLNAELERSQHEEFKIPVEVKQEERDPDENPEVHFPTFPDGKFHFSILETGYQLLDSLEAEGT